MMDEKVSDTKRFGYGKRKNPALDNSTEIDTAHFRVLPSLKVYSLSTQPPSAVSLSPNPINSASVEAAATNTGPFSPPRAFITIKPTVSDTEPTLSDQYNDQELPRDEPAVPACCRHAFGAPLPDLDWSSVAQARKRAKSASVAEVAKVAPVVTETLYSPPPVDTRSESSRSLLFSRAVKEKWLTAGVPLRNMSGTRIDQEDERITPVVAKIRDAVIKVRQPLAEYQSVNGVPADQQISFIDLVRMMFVCSQTAIFTVMTMFWNLYPLLDGFLYILRFMLDKTLYVCEAETPMEMGYRGFIFAVEIMILILACVFILSLIVLPILYLIVHTMTNVLRLMGIMN